MKTIPGVEIGVSRSVVQLQVADNGCLGQFSDKYRYYIRVIVADEEMVPIAVDKDNNIFVMAPRGSIGGLGQYFHHDLKIFTSLDGVPCTKYPNNHFRLLKLADDGKLNIWTVSVISQNGEFFLSVEEMFSGQCYWEGGSDGKLVCPDLKWLQMFDFLNKEYDVVHMLFPSIKDYKQPEASLEIHLEPGMAQVLWFNAARGFGALRTPEGNARVHWSQVEKRDGLSYLETGELVSYEKLQLPVDTTQNKTAFKLEAVGVKPLCVVVES